MKKAAMTLLIILITGCAIYPNIYNEHGLSRTEMANVRFETPPLFTFDGTFYGSITGVWDENSEKVIEVENGFGYGTKSHQEVFLEPGKYLIQAYCESGNLRANPHILMAVNSRQSYTLKCVVRKRKKNIFGSDVADEIGLEIFDIAPISEDSL